MRIVAMLVFLFTTSVVQAQWLPQQEKEFLESCNSSCAVQPGSADICKRRCNCMMTELKRIYPDYLMADEGARRSDPAILKTVSERQQHCIREIPQ